MKIKMISIILIIGLFSILIYQAVQEKEHRTWRADQHKAGVRVELVNTLRQLEGTIRNLQSGLMEQPGFNPITPTLISSVEKTKLAVDLLLYDNRTLKQQEAKTLSSISRGLEGTSFFLNQVYDYYSRARVPFTLGCEHTRYADQEITVKMIEITQMIGELESIPGGTIEERWDQLLNQWDLDAAERIWACQ